MKSKCPKLKQFILSECKTCVNIILTSHPGPQGVPKVVPVWGGGVIISSCVCLPACPSACLCVCMYVCLWMEGGVDCCGYGLWQCCEAVQLNSFGCLVLVRKCQLQRTLASMILFAASLSIVRPCGVVGEGIRIGKHDGKVLARQLCPHLLNKGSLISHCDGTDTPTHKKHAMERLQICGQLVTGFSLCMCMCVCVCASLCAYE